MLNGGGSIRLIFPNYQAGTKGPEAADILLENDGRSWWDIDDFHGQKIKI